MLPYSTYTPFEGSGVWALAQLGLGGYSSDSRRLYRLIFGREPTTPELAAFVGHNAAKGAQLGPRWIAGAKKDRAFARLVAAGRAPGLLKGP